MSLLGFAEYIAGVCYELPLWLGLKEAKSKVPLFRPRIHPYFMNILSY
jgi:hypothetical protein